MDFMAHDKLKITLVEAYNAVYHYDVIAISETFLNSKINDSDICIQGFSHDVFRKDHPNDTSKGRYITERTYRLPGKKSWNTWWDNSLPNQHEKKKGLFCCCVSES